MTTDSGPDKDALPLPDYDHLTTGSLQSRIRSLDGEGVRQLLAYEQNHGNRLAVVQILESRLRMLDDGAEPSAGSPLAATPEVTSAPPGGSKGVAADERTAGQSSVPRRPHQPGSAAGLAASSNRP